MVSRRDAHKDQRSSEANLARCLSGNLQWQQEMGVDLPVRLPYVELRQVRVAATRARDQDVVDRGR